MAQDSQSSPAAQKPSASRGLPARILLLLVGSFVSTMGIAMTTVADLGTTPVSTIPYTLTQFDGLTFGTNTFLINAVFLLGQILVLRSRFRLWNLLQLPAVLVFGLMLDLSMLIISPHAPAGWWGGLAMSMTGNLVLAAGIVMQIRSNTIVQPGEGIVLAIATVLRKNFGTLKILNDFSLSVIAALIGWIVLGHVVGIREGTLISAFLIGFFVRIISRVFPEKKA